MFLKQKNKEESEHLYSEMLITKSPPHLAQNYSASLIWTNFISYFMD